MASTIENKDGSRIATRITASTSCGMIWKNSAMRISTPSSQPPK